MKTAKKSVKKTAKKETKQEKEVREAKEAIQVARRKICDAEKAAYIAEKEVYEAAKVTKGKQKNNLVKTVVKVEKATYTAGESCECAQEADAKIHDL